MLSYVRRHKSRFLVAAVILLALGAGLAAYLWKRSTRLPQPGDPVYEEYVDSFESGVVALDVGVTHLAEENFDQAIKLIPQEPAAWSNRALLKLRTARPKEAESDLREAERLTPDDPDTAKIRGLLENSNGKYAAAIASFRKATAKDPHDLEALYFLAELIKRESKENDPESDAEYQRLMEQILADRPNNKHVVRERLLIAVRRADRAAVAEILTRLRLEMPTWTNSGTERIQDWFVKLEKAFGENNWPEVGDLARVFSNLYQAQEGYQLDATEVTPRGGYLGHPLRTFRVLAPMRPTPAPPDTEISFTPEALADAPAGPWKAAAPVWLTGEGNPVVFVANDRELRRVGSPAVLKSPQIAPNGIVAIDWNNDFRTDLLLVGSKGLLFYQQGADGNFEDVTAKTALAPEVLNGDYVTALAADTDLDGDLDVILARRNAPPLHLRNNFDGTFTAQVIFPEVNGARVFAWADLDHDGAPDAAVIDSQGKLHVYANERSGKFKPWPVPPPAGKFLAVAISDADEDGILDLIALRDDGAILRISDRNKRGSWDVAELSRWEVPAGSEPGTVRLLVGDLDNNGVPDLIVSGSTGSAAWLGSGGGKFDRLAAALPPNVTAVADLTGSGRLALLALDSAGAPIRSRNTGTKDYHYLTVRFRSFPTKEDKKGDERINSFGIGGEFEFRTGTHVVKMPVAGPTVHAGLGTRTRCAVLRIKWPNGGAQVEFPKQIDHVEFAEQRLKASCPFLFAWNGERFVFVTDFMWSTPLGMYINAQDQGDFLQTSEWVRIRGDQLVPKDGFYEVRINANLWETHFFDHLSLRVIDHPPDTELYSDERFMLVRSKPTYHLTGPTKPVAKALDHHGADVTEIVRAVDGKYLDRAGRGKYQGITNDHWVEVDLGEDAPKEGAVFLIAHGWLHPTDSSVNYAIEQGQHVKPQALVLEVPDGKGGWRVAQDKLGFPAGKNKTLTLRLDGIDGPGVARRFRLRTNMEIYWDALHYARGRDDSPRAERDLLPVVADLHFRGILEMTQADKSSPELPHYDRLISRRQVWRDLIGYHTRYGDIRELLEKIDDRYAIVTAGDEITLKFAVPPDPPAGWKRDFIWVSDGWVKDGDLNTRFGKTVLPLPSHDMTNYTTPPTRLEDDNVFKRHRKDWDVFHMRYVAPDEYERGLRAFKRR